MTTKRDPDLELLTIAWELLCMTFIGTAMFFFALMT